MEHVLRNTLYALIEAGDAKLPDILRILSDKNYRYTVVSRVKNEQVRSFWTDEFKAYNPRYRQEMIAPIQNKVGAFLADPKLRRIFTDVPVNILATASSKGILLKTIASLLYKLAIKPESPPPNEWPVKLTLAE